jgi:uncharacterized PurR-regulated membrane protein YhhQ (DUF165 family)
MRDVCFISLSDGLQMTGTVTLFAFGDRRFRKVVHVGLLLGIASSYILSIRILSVTRQASARPTHPLLSHPRTFE